MVLKHTGVALRAPLLACLSVVACASSSPTPAHLDTYGMTDRPPPPHEFSSAFQDAVALTQGVGIEQDVARGADALDGLCSSGDPDACTYAWLRDPTRFCAIPREPIQNEIRAHGNQIRACYENSDDFRQGKTGRLPFTFTFDEESRVFFVREGRENGFSISFVDCVKRVIFGLRIPKPHCTGHGLILVNYPFVFRTD